MSLKAYTTIGLAHSALFIAAGQIQNRGSLGDGLGMILNILFAFAIIPAWPIADFVFVVELLKGSK